MINDLSQARNLFGRHDHGLAFDIRFDPAP
jgi:hypothetical protein